MIATAGGSAVLGQAAHADASDATVATVATGASAPGPASSSVETPLALDNIQGNVLGGFNKDHQRFLVFGLGRPAAARQWLADMVDEVATAGEVAGFNRLFQKARARRGNEAQAPTSQWINVAFTYTGLAALDVKDRDLARFPADFRQGMAARAARIGDVGSERAFVLGRPVRLERPPWCAHPGR